MKILILIIAIVFIALLMAAILKSRRRTESRININEHPSTFKKPEIEMVNKPPTQAGASSADFNDTDRKPAEG